MTGHSARVDEWIEATGLKRSKASVRSVLRWLPEYCYADGFDHTFVYYWPRKRVHILVTEPYHSVDVALAGLRAVADKRGAAFSFAIGAADVGLWYPGHCRTLIVGCEWMGDFLDGFAAALPTMDDLQKSTEGHRRQPTHI